MNINLKTVLEERLNKNYEDFIAQLHGKSVSELIALAPEITAAQQLHEELLNACNDDDGKFLLQFDNLLEVVRGYWADEITGCDHSDEISHMLWEIRDREMYSMDAINAPEPLPKPKMQLSEKEHRLALIAGKASNTLHGVGQHQQAGEVFQGVMEAKDRESALRVIEKYIDVEVVPAIRMNRKPAKKEKKPHER